jgi:hypothetical protein
MPSLNAGLITAIAKVDPLNLAILFVGLSSLGVIWLASIVIKSSNQRGKK